ncbi:MAG: hypothetical protein ACLUCH_05375 [Lachnospirales bacterium]
MTYTFIFAIFVIALENYKISKTGIFLIISMGLFEIVSKILS